MHIFNFWTARLLGRMETLGCEMREEAVLRTLTQDVLKSSEIEGEHPRLDRIEKRLDLADYPV